MRTVWSKLMSSVGSLSAGTSGALLLVVALCLGATAYAQKPPIVVSGTSVQIGTMKFNGSGGGWDGGESPIGGTFVIGANGNVIIGDGYSGTVDVFEITPSGTQTVIGAGGTNSHAAAIDTYGNVYVGFGYSGTIVKLPYNPVTGAYAELHRTSER